jgi:hypothetical protein
MVGPFVPRRTCESLDLVSHNSGDDVHLGSGLDELTSLASADVSAPDYETREALDEEVDLI